MILHWAIYVLVICHTGIIVNGQVSCAQLKQDGDTTDGMKTINPEETGDASGNLNVQCDMTSEPDDGITIINHDYGDNILIHGSTYQSGGSYSRPITYDNVDRMEQMTQLIQKSAQCEQYIEFKCHHSALWLYKNSPYVWWKDRDGIDMYMWGGGKTYNRTCKCGLDGSCASTVEMRCNCDTNDLTLRNDGGFITDRDRLPVTKLYAGDADLNYEYAFLTLGPLKCRGFALPALRSCAEVKAAGFTKTDSYLLDPDGNGSENAYWAYCDLDVYEDEVVTVVFHDVPYRTYVKGYHNPKYQQMFTYRASDAQLIQLTKDSERCQQYFDIDCLHIQFHLCNWNTIDGREITNWGGKVDEAYACPCSLDDSCDSSSDSCSCDLNDSTWREDSGYIFNRDDLPVKTIMVADTDGSREELYYRIGPLECTGRVVKTITHGTSCYKVIKETLTWDQAAKKCLKMNGHLVTIDDESRSFITKLTKSIAGPMSTMWSGTKCTTVDENESTSCEKKYGYICESKLIENQSFKNIGSDISQPESSLLSVKKAISNGACSLYCQQDQRCASFSYNSDTHECKLNSETTESNTVEDQGFTLFLLETTYHECSLTF